MKPRVLPLPSATSIARCWQTDDIARTTPSRARATTIGSPMIWVVK